MEQSTRRDAAPGSEWAQHQSVRIDTRKHPVSIGHGSVLHADVTISATNGPVAIGRYCVLDDQCTVENKLPPRADGTPQTLVVGDYCVLGPRSEMLGVSLGRGSALEAMAVVGSGCHVGDGCTVMATCRVPPHTDVAESTVVYGRDAQWRSVPRDMASEESRARGLSRFFRQHMRTKQSS